jgi:hypothetical protein
VGEAVKKSKEQGVIRRGYENAENVFLVIMAFAAAFAVGNEQAFTSIEALGTWLAAQPGNTPETAYNVALNVSSISGIGWVLSRNENKYLYFDLSGSTITEIGDLAFTNCTSLAAVTIGKCVTSIGDWAFARNSGLTGITIPDSIKIIENGFYLNSFHIED